MLDPQQLSWRGRANALIALGRIPLASEVPLWCLFGCLTSSQVFPAPHSRGDGPFKHFDWWATVQCMLVTWLTNISINYANEYFDYDLDRPGMVASIKRDLEERRKVQDQGLEKQKEVKAEQHSDDISKKVMGSTTRIIHDGTFPPVTALILASLVQLGILLLMYTSRQGVHFTASRAGAQDSPFRGLALQIGIICTILSQSYVGPPLRLHYRGAGELVSALLLSPVSFLFGLVGHYTAATGRSVALFDLFASVHSTNSGFYLDNQIWALLGSFYCFEQARILIMHVHDIEVDRIGGKITFCVRVGRAWASRLYLLLTAGCAWFTWIIFEQLEARQGMVLRVGGSEVAKTIAGKVGVGWKTGAIVVGSYALPVVLVTAKSLFAELGEGQGTMSGVDKVVLSLFPKFIPTTSSENLAKMVSLVNLVTPLVLSAVLTVTVLAVSP